MSVDDLVESVVKALDSNKVLDNTYVIFMSDNGYHLGMLSLSFLVNGEHKSDCNTIVVVIGIINCNKVTLVNFSCCDRCLQQFTSCVHLLTCLHLSPTCYHIHITRVICLSIARPVEVCAMLPL